MRFTDFAYDSAIRTLRIATPALSRGDSKLARGMRGRREAAARLVGWAESHREPARPLIWFHAPSVGEGLQARAILDALKTLDPRVQTVFTHFSPSAEPLARKVAADVADYLPWDVVREVGPVLDALRPTLIAFTKTEVWPVLAREAAERSTLLALVAATLPAGSSRLSKVARPVLRPAFARLATVHAITEEDTERFELLGVDRTHVIVTGDPGIDSAAERAAQADPEAAYLKVFASPGARIVAGSTWPADEDVLLPAMRLLREGPQRFQIVIAPHEPGPSQVAALVERLRNEGWQPATLAEAESEGSADAWNAVVVDRVGILAHLYTVATVAYVGGGFHDKGLHSVLEPAAAGVPACFGPRHQNAHAAEKLVQAGGARVSRGAGELFKIMSEWLTQRKRREAAGEAAAAYVQRHRGASLRSADLLLEAVGTRT